MKRSFWSTYGSCVPAVVFLVFLGVWLAYIQFADTHIDMPDSFGDYAMAFDKEMQAEGYSPIPVVNESWDGSMSKLSYGYAYDTPEGFAYFYEVGKSTTMYVPEHLDPTSVYAKVFPDISFMEDMEQVLADGRTASWMFGTDQPLHVYSDNDMDVVSRDMPKTMAMASHFHPGYDDAADDIISHKDEGKLSYFYTRYGDVYSEWFVTVWDSDYNTLHSMHTILRK